VPVNISIRDKIGENRAVGEQDFQPKNQSEFRRKKAKPKPDCRGAAFRTSVNNTRRL
jgi:endonuclease I